MSKIIKNMIQCNTCGDIKSSYHFMHKMLKTTSAELCLSKAGVVKVSSKCRQNPKNDVSRKSQKGKMP